MIRKVLRKIVYCILDTETVGGASHPTGFYHLAGKIATYDGTLNIPFNIIVLEKFAEINMDSYAKKNIHLYEKMIENGVVTAVPTEEDAVALVESLCTLYNVKYMMAYNTGFDFVKTKCRELIKNREFIDVYLMALQTVTHLKKYASFCRENGLCSSSKKSVATSAESVYAFITGNADYKEEHTAFEDSKIEEQIFLYCRNMHKKFTKNMHAWDCKENKCFPKWTE